MSTNRLALVIALILPTVVSIVPRDAAAHGIWGHIHVTGWAIENLPPGELRDFFAEPEVMNAALFGAAFTDSGYWVQAGPNRDAARWYSEHTHWEPFIEDYVQWMVENDPPPWDSLESRMRVGFLMGCASHGLQDEIFDSLFLFQVQEHDNGSQDNADPGTDGFVALEDHIRFFPTPYFPTDTLMELYTPLNESITPEVIESSVNVMVTIYVNDSGGTGVAESYGGQYADELVWTRAHYLDPEIPGSLRAEIIPTGRYMQAIWERLNQTWDANENLVIHTYPEPPRRLLGVDAESPDSWITFIFGQAIRASSISLDLQTADGEPVGFDVQGTRWGNDWGRLARIQPQTSLDPGEFYRAMQLEGGEMIDGSSYDGSFELVFQAPCDDVSAELCEDLGEIDIPRIDGVIDEPDAGDMDAGETDAGPDASESQPDAESGIDAMSPDSGATPESGGGGGGGCASVPHAPTEAGVLALLGLFSLRRRRE